MKKINWLLVAIIIFAAFLRLWKLNSYPALNADEAAIGYNAYSLIQTGLDEHGNPWPIHFQSFNDYKPGLYFYMVLPFVRFVGLNEWAVRFPNALLGTLTVYILYLLVAELKFKNLQENGSREHSPSPPFKIEEIAAFMLAISPWHIHFSRGGWEVNTATFFMTLGLLLFIKARNNIKLLFISSLFFVLSFYTYHAARIVVPLLIFGMLGIYRQEIKKNFKFYFLSAVFAFVLLVPLGLDLVKPEVSSRAAGVGLFADPGPLNRINEERGEHIDYSGTLPKVIHNKAVNYTLAFFENWSAHYHGLFLFLSGDDIQRDKVPETGQMYIFDIFLVIIGLWWVAENLSKESRLIIHWLLIAPVAAALTFQSPHALRSENMVIPLVVISSLGFSVLLKKLMVIKNSNIKNIGYLLTTLVVIWGFARYEHMYWIHMSKEYPYSSQYGVRELVNYVRENNNNYKNIVVTQKYDQPYILFLFYMKYPPGRFQKEHELTAKDQYGFSTVGSFDKYIFKNINWDSDKIDYPDSLIAGAKDEIPKEANIVKKIYGTNEFEYFDIVAN